MGTPRRSAGFSSAELLTSTSNSKHWLSASTPVSSRKNRVSALSGAGESIVMGPAGGISPHRIPLSRRPDQHPNGGHALLSLEFPLRLPRDRAVPPATRFSL